MKRREHLAIASLTAIAFTALASAAQARQSAEATLVEVRGTVPVVDLIGDYDVMPGNGESRRVAREAVARAFYAGTSGLPMPDDYDFLIAFTTFDYELDDDPDDEREVAAFYLPVRNDTLGIGTPLLDDGVRFGSASRLQGYVDAGPLDGWVLDPLDPDFGELLSTVAHELMHRWSARVRFRLPDGTLSDELLGHQQSHWSFLADTGGGSLMYGNEWVTLGGDGPGDGRFVSGLLRDAFNPFDLYLAGFLEAHEVPPMRLIRSDDAAADDVAGPGIEIEGEEVHVSIDDVIAAEGPRDPPASTAQRQFRAAFVLVTRPGDEVTHRQVAAIERTALELQSRWSILTGGRSVLQTAAPLTLTDLEPGGPDPVRGGTVRPDPAVIADALDWLRSRQAPEGYWEDLLATRMRDTGVVLDVLGRLDALFSGESDALAWLGDESPSSTDGLARNVLALRAGGAASPSTLRDALRALQNADGGWGLGAGYQSDPLDTALALVALGSVDPAFAAGRNYLLAAQGPDGSWGTVAGGAGRIPATALALRALALGGVAATPEASAAFAWLATKQNPDGGVGDSPSTAHDTAWALSTLQAHGALDVIDAGIAAAFLSTRQSVEGSWDGSVYTTALAADALQRLAFPNLAFAMPPTFEPDPALDGDGVRFLVPVLNDGGVVAPATVLEIWNGEPGGAGAPVAVCALPSIVPGATHGCEAVWDTTGQAGSHRVVLLLDAAGTLAELSETDNRFELDVEIGVSPLEADLEVRAAEVLVDPASPSTLPAPVSVTAIVRNNGRTDASDVAVTLVLRTGAGAAGEELVGLEVLPLLTARSSLPVSFAFELTAPGASELVLTADPEGLLDEGRIDNNTATVPIETTPSLDLAVNATDLEVIGVPLPGATVQLRVQAHNRGTLDANEVALLVALDTVPVAGAPERTVLLDEPVQIPAGGSVVRQVPWTVDREGELDLVAVLDLGNLAPEADETNNQASLRFLAGSLGLTNLRLLPGSLAVSPEPALEGAELAVSATLDNNGGALADEVVVALFEGHPEQGGVEMVRIQLAPLAPGEVQGFDLIVPELEGPQDRVLFLVVDPDGSLEEAVEDDNVLFRNLEVRGFADLAIGPAALGLDPAFPFPGQPASLEVEIANLGEQEAAATMLEVFAGDPLAGGVLLASAPTAALPAGALAATSVVFTPDPALEPGAVLELVVLVDRADVVRERSASNNRAVLEMLIGGGAANVSERWFSPNGDGVKDTTTFFFAAPQSGTFRVEVRDGEERPVVASTDLEAGSGTSSFRWDGRDGTGRLAADGDYSFRLVDGGGAELARTPVTLDTDRSPLLDAIGTAYEHVTDLTCQVPATGSDELAWSGDERWAFFVAGLGGARGVHRVRVDGSGLERIANLPDLDVSASDSGRYLAARGTSNRLFFADLQTGARSHVDLSTRIDRVLGFVPGEDRVVALARDAVHAVDVVSGSVTTLHEAAGARFRSVAESMNSSALPSESRRSFAPDGSSVLVARQLGPGARLLAIDLVSTAVHDLGPFRTSDPSSIRSATWLDGGPRIALGRLGSIEIFAGNGAPLASFTIPELPPPSTIVFPGEEPQPFPDDYIHTGSVGDLHGDGGGRRLLVEVPFIVSSPEACIDGARETFWVLDLGLGTWTRLDDDDDAPTPVFGCGSFHVETRDGGGFVERAVVHHGLRYRESTIDLSRHLPDAGGELRVRVRQAGGDNAHLDSLLLEIDGVILPPTSAVLVGVPGSGSTSITAELGALDHEVAAVGDATVEAVWTIDDSELAERLASDPPIHLRLIGREEYLEGREARPIELPAARPDGLEVVIGAAGALVVDGEQTVADALGAPLLRERARPDTGHPQGNVLGWVRSDGERLYAALDFTVDNTRDAEGDWGVLLVDGGSGWRELRVTETDSRWGRAGFGSSGAVAYPHRYYEFSIPLEELGLEVGDTARVRFAGYGTAALLDGAGAGFHTMKARGFLGDRSHVLFENRELGAASLGLRLERARDVEVPLFAEWNVARDFQPTVVLAAATLALGTTAALV
ncbi:MAG TPA: CARDB domain-containing protein, partial [Thermoanaerobaculia bacterium]|nr:CARDB domain-containing protein [Thermoanaerobaculia bacterium]